MTAVALFRWLLDQGVQMALCPEDDTIRCRAAKGTLTPGLVAVMREHKDGLLAILERYEERAAMYEFDARMSRQDAERQALLDLPLE